MLIAEIQYGYDWISSRTPWQPEFVEDLKVSIPPSDRRWAPDEKIWLIRRSYRRTLLALLDFYFDRVVVVGGGKAGSASSPGSPALSPVVAAYGELHLRESAPPELVNAAYRCLALLTHPDHNAAPDATSRMQALNAAYNTLREAGRS